MRKGLLSFLGACLFAQGSVFAQILPNSSDLSTPFDIAPLPSLTSDPAVPDVSWHGDSCQPYRMWASTEYMLWRVKDAPVPLPLVTTGNPAVGQFGAIGQSTTRILFGDSGVNFNNFSGMHAAVGGWIDSDRSVGIEGSGFLLECRANTFSAGSSPAGNPSLFFPFFTPNNGAGKAAESSASISNPVTGFAGNVSITSSLQLWGTEFNGILNIMRRPGLEISLLAGFRYADLQENLDIRNSTTDLILGNVQNLTDHFGTRNQFYGGQLGAKISWQRENWFVDVAGKVALGDTHQVVETQGSINQTALPGGMAPMAGTFPGGLYTAPTNIGRISGNEFTVLPSLEFKVGYQITPHIRAYAGYDFMYWNQVVRPGNQIDHNVNQTQNPVISGGAFHRARRPTGAAANVPAHRLLGSGSHLRI